MRYLLILMLISLITVLGCTPAPKPAENESEVVQASSEPTFEEAMASYTPGQWIESWDEALKSSQELNRPILVNFTGSDWCSWCIKLSNEVFTQEAFINFAKANVILLKLDFPKKIAQSTELKNQNQMLQRKFGIQGYPTIVLVNGKGEEIDRTSYQPGGAESYVKHLNSLIAKK